MFLSKKSVKLPGSPKCPTCQTVLDGYTHVNMEEKKVVIGSICICMYCGTPLTYQGTMYRKMNELELFELRFNPEFRKAEEASRQFRRLKQQ